MNRDEITNLHAEMMKAYRSHIYWLRRDAGMFRDPQKREELLNKRTASEQKYRELKAAYYNSIKQP